MLHIWFAKLLFWALWAETLLQCINVFQKFELVHSLMTCIWFFSRLLGCCTGINSILKNLWKIWLTSHLYLVGMLLIIFVLFRLIWFDFEQMFCWNLLVVPQHCILLYGMLPNAAILFCLSDQMSTDNKISFRGLKCVLRASRKMFLDWLRIRLSIDSQLSSSGAYLAR